jgi:hypothetical protein
VEEGALCQFSYSEDGQTFTPIGREFRAREGHWIGAKIGLFCINPNQESGRQEPGRGFVDVAWFHFDE